jgi:hypothetical protein
MYQQEAVQFVIHNAKNTKILKTLEESNDVIQYHVLAKHRDNNPDLYNMWKHPALWDHGLTINIHVDVPMHLLFLGVMKTVAKQVMEWTKLHSTNNNFIRVASPALQAVARCNLDWCTT